MDEATVVVLKLDLKHLSNVELEWLHDLRHRIQIRMLEARKGA